MFARFQNTIRAAFMAAAVLTIVGCSETVSPVAGDDDTDILEVNVSTGETSIDTIDLNDRWPSRAPSWRDDIPPIVRQLEVEEFGAEAVEHITSNWGFDVKSITAMQDDERSQHAALGFMLNRLDLDELADSLDANGGAGFGLYNDDSTQAQWEYLELCRPKDTTEAYVAFTYVCEYQLKRSLDGLNSSQSAEERELWNIIVNMNKNHFVAMLRRLSASGVTFKPWFLTPAQVLDFQDDAYIVL